MEEGFRAVWMALILPHGVALVKIAHEVAGEAAGLPREEAVRRFTVNALATHGPVAEIVARRLSRPQDSLAWSRQAAASQRLGA